MLTFHEGKACEAIVRCLEERAVRSRADLRWPERERHPFPVEVAFSIDNQLFAMEHTGIEPFKGHVRMNVEAARHLSPIIDALNEYLGWTYEFELLIPAKAFQGRTIVEVRAIQRAIIDWFKASAFTLPLRPRRDRYSQVPSIGPTKIPGVPFPVSLYRFDETVTSSHPFDISYFVSNAELLRNERISRAIERKFPKLAAWKRDEGARTVLVLESNTVFLEDYALIAEMFSPLAIARSDRPDETYLVDSSRERWLAFPILIDGMPFFELLRTNEVQPSELDPNTLVSLTMR